jgi:hypothetical protein
LIQRNPKFPLLSGREFEPAALGLKEPLVTRGLVVRIGYPLDPKLRSPRVTEIEQKFRRKPELLSLSPAALSIPIGQEAANCLRLLSVCAKHLRQRNGYSQLNSVVAVFFVEYVKD